jgi:hypothetical protein
MKEQVIITPIFITRKGELKSFQIRIPPDAKSLLGFEATGLNVDTNDNPFGALPFGLYEFQRSFLLGEIRVQSCGKANLFYSAQVTLTDRNLGFGDFSQSSEWFAQRWTHGYTRYQDPVHIEDCSPVLFGTYRDTLGQQRNVDVPYIVNVYMWYERRER